MMARHGKKPQPGKMIGLFQSQKPQPGKMVGLFQSHPNVDPARKTTAWKNGRAVSKPPKY